MSDLTRRKTKIVATLGPATDAPGVLDALIAAGLDCARLNCSHATPNQLLDRAEAVRVAARRAGRPVGLLFDLQGPKLRLSQHTAERHVVVGDEITFCPAGGSETPSHAPVDFDGFARLVSERSEIVIGDGMPRFAVERIDGDVVHTRAVSTGRLAPRKGINVIHARPELPALTDKDLADLAAATTARADFIALSFVRSAADIQQLRDLLDTAGSRARIVAKIETLEAYDRLDEIIEAADGVMVARGDYGITAGLAHVPLMQKDTITRTTHAGKLVITATHMLESMIDSPEPTRAEVADIANAVIDGTSAVMLSAETGVGRHPVKAVEVMSEVAAAAEETPIIHGRAETTAPQGDGSTGAVMHAAVALAGQIAARVIVVPTTSGGAVRACAKFRASTPIIALAHDQVVANQLTMEWGVQPLLVDVDHSPQHLTQQALQIAGDFGALDSGDRVVLTAGPPTFSPGATNAIIVRELP